MEAELMQLFDRLTEDTRNALLLARTAATTRGAMSVDTVDVLTGLVNQSGTEAARLLSHAGVTTSIATSIGVAEKPTTQPVLGLAFTDATKAVLQAAAENADVFQDVRVTPEHLLLALLQVSLVPSGLAEHGIDVDSLRTSVRSYLSECNRQGK
jgi:ATP-dependent Clp protease ATP-binding subunit ClpA